MLAFLLAIAAAPALPQPDVATPPRLRSGSISDTDYPAAAIRAEEQGTVAMALRIDERGSVAECRVAETSRSAVLDATSCSLATLRFKFVPARNAQGRPVASEVQQRIVWRLPKDASSDLPVPVFAQGEMRLSLLQDTIGTRCSIETSGDSFEQMRDMACPVSLRVVPAELAAEPNAMMTVTTITPSGSAAPVRPPIRVLLMGRMASDVEVAANGHLLACRDVDVPGANVRMPSVCRAMNLPIPAFQPDPAGQVRRGRVQVEIYRLGSPET